VNALAEPGLKHPLFKAHGRVGFVPLGDAHRHERLQDSGIRGPPALAKGALVKRNGFVTIGMLAIAASVALMLVAWHAAPQASGFSASTAEGAAEARLRTADTMLPLQPFDEHFVETD
jgi:hypothetical protein